MTGNLEIENELLLREHYQLTAEELLVVKLLLLASLDEGHPEYLQRYMSLPNKVDLREIIISLQEKSVILKSFKVPNKGEPFNPQSVTFNSVFHKTYYKASGDMGFELFTNYPSIITIKGSVYSLRNVAKKYNTLEEFFFAYGKAIKFNPSTHIKVMNLLEWGKEHDLINYNICEFVISRKWLELEQLKDSGFNNEFYDSIESI